MAFVLGMFAITTVQKNVRDLAASDRQLTLRVSDALGADGRG